MPKRNYTAKEAPATEDRMAGIKVGGIFYRLEHKGDGNIPYELHGPRGAHYGLMRNGPNPHMLFAVNLRSLGVVDRLGWFDDKDGTLKVAS